jgi:acetyl-CoA C-acetyltransferase
MGAHAIRAAVERAGIESDRIEDCIMGAALTQGTSGMNIGRKCSAARWAAGVCLWYDD